MNDLKANHIIDKIKALVGEQGEIQTGNSILPLLKGFRGKEGNAIAAVTVNNTLTLYRLLKLCKELKVGYVPQGANTALKGQGTPQGTSQLPVIIIQTKKLKQYKLLDHPNSSEHKILLVEPGLSLKETESILENEGYDLPHKIGSHELGNTFGGSCATGCGGVRVDNRDGTASMTENGNAGVVSISAEGFIYNGIFKPEKITSGEMLLNKIDQNNFTIDDIFVPDKAETHVFLQKMFTPKSYPIKNHRGSIIFSGEGGEGSQFFVFQMYLIRKKPKHIKTYCFVIPNETLKENLYKEVIFANGADNTDQFPILCESMNEPLVKLIVNKGVNFASAVFFALAPARFGRYVPGLLKIRNKMICYFGKAYILLENYLGKILSFMFTPKILKKTKYHEIVLIQFADRDKNHISLFEKQYSDFLKKYPEVKQISIIPKSFQEKLFIQIRNVSALATLTWAWYAKGELLAFDDAIMPGSMTTTYANKLKKQLSEYTQLVLYGPYLYGHDLKQINHNDFIISDKLSIDKLQQVHAIQHACVSFIGGHAHAEHGIGDYSDTDLNEEELIKLVAHRILNDPLGIANPGGGQSRAFEKVKTNQKIIDDAVALSYGAIERETKKKTLLTISDDAPDSIKLKLIEQVKHFLLA